MYSRDERLVLCFFVQFALKKGPTVRGRFWKRFCPLVNWCR